MPKERTIAIELGAYVPFNTPGFAIRTHERPARLCNASPICLRLLTH
jgi:hypothetical protein